MAIRRHTSRSTVSISNRVNSASLALIESRNIPPFAEYLVVAGGGGGGWYGAGGGAGGYLAGNAFLSFGSVYTVTVGAGGAIGPSDPGIGGNGSNSLITAAQPNTVANVLAYGGGGGGRNGAFAGNDGGSGGGGGIGYAGGKGVYPGSTFVSSTRQGYDGGGFPAGGGNYLAGGGGGASEIGGSGFNSPNEPPATAGNGGNGLIWVNGVYYAGGGGGNGYPSGQRKGQGGLGGGATAPAVAISFGANGTINTGGGASGGGYGNPVGGATIPGGAGGSGVVIFRWPTASNGANNYTGNVVYTNAGGYHTYSFYSSGTITI